MSLHESVDWTMVASLVGVVAVLVSVVLFAVGRKRKRFLWSIEAQTPLVRGMDEAGARIGITYDGLEVAQPDLILLRMRNAGNQEISVTDFQDSIRVTLTTDEGPKPKPLSVEVVKTNDPALHPQVSIEQGDLVLRPILLNPHDSFELRIIGEALVDSDVKLIGRIAGVSRIVREVSGERRSTARAATLTGTVVALSGLLLWRPEEMIEYVVMPGLIAAMVFVTYLIFRYPERFASQQRD